MPSTYQWIQYSAARAILAHRLADPGNLFWTDAENGLYLREALRTYNALTEIWNTDFTFNVDDSATWWNVSTVAESPRVRTVTDADLYTLMQYHLLEQPTGAGTWTGTSQFSLPVLQGALQRRRDEVIQVSGCNMTQLAVMDVLPNTHRIALPDNILEPRRARFLPSAAPPLSPITLTREDSSAWDHFTPAHLQTSSLPTAWSVIAGPPLTLDMDTAPNVPGTADVLALVSGPIFAPPAATLLGIPDDWAWVAKWGALADLLSQESETTDLPRAEFCRQRYMDGLKAMGLSNWLLLAEINGVPVDTPSVRELDSFSPEWEEDAGAWPGIVLAGTDLIAPCPLPTSQIGVLLTLVGNAPIPILDTDYLQIARDAFDAILSYAQFLAMFKQGGAEFTAGTKLMAEFAMAVQSTNARISQMGLFADVLRTAGRREEVEQPR